MSQAPIELCLQRRRCRRQSANRATSYPSSPFDLHAGRSLIQTRRRTVHVAGRSFTVLRYACGGGSDTLGFILASLQDGRLPVTVEAAARRDDSYDCVARCPDFGESWGLCQQRLAVEIDKACNKSPASMRSIKRE